MGRDEPIDRETLASICERVGVEQAHSRRNVRLAVLIIVIGLLIVIAGLALDANRRGPGGWRGVLDDVLPMAPILVASLGGGVLGPMYATRQKRMAKLRRLMLSFGRCPHCGYGVGSVPPANDLVICPECSCAWEASWVGAEVDDVGVRADGPSKGTLAIIAGVLGLVVLLGAIVAVFLLR